MKPQSNLHVHLGGFYILKNGMKAEVYSIHQEKHLYYTRIYNEDGSVYQLVLFDSTGKVKEACSEGHMTLCHQAPVDGRKYVQYQMVREVPGLPEDACRWEYYGTPNYHWQTSCRKRIPACECKRSYIYCPFCGLKIK